MGHAHQSLSLNQILQVLDCSGIIAALAGPVHPLAYDPRLKHRRLGFQQLFAGRPVKPSADVPLRIVLRELSDGNEQQIVF